MKATIDGVEITLTTEQIKQIEDAKKPKQTAKEWLEEFMKQEFTVKFAPGYITYYLDNHWIFDIDLKSNNLWCYYERVWKVFEKEFGMNSRQIQALLSQTVATSLNCKDFTPHFSLCVNG